MMISVLPIPAFEDNYIWLLHNGNDAIVVDPGDATPVYLTLEKMALDLKAILITHHHHDHIGGVDALLNSFPECHVYAPNGDRYPFRHQSVMDGDFIAPFMMNIYFKVFHTPGHTVDHIVYYCESENLLFCGDTLFSAGCGRLFEGTAEQMYQSLMRLGALPDDTLVYCTHEYTKHNLRFAQTVEPENVDLKKRIQAVDELRLYQKPSLPSNIRLERLTNPFLRCDSLEIRQHLDKKSASDLEVFTALRQARNHF